MWINSQNPLNKCFRVRWNLLILRKIISQCGNFWKKIKEDAGAILLHTGVGTWNWLSDPGFCGCEHLIIEIYLYNSSPVQGFVPYFCLVFIELIFSFWPQSRIFYLKLFFFFKSCNSHLYEISLKAHVT